METPESGKIKSKKQHQQPLEDEDGYAGSSSSIETQIQLPKPVINRVNALKNLQLKMVNIETKFYEELHQLEFKYASMYEPLYDQREKIINAQHEPTKEEYDWPYDDIFANDDKQKQTTTETQLSNELADKAVLNEDDNNKIKGIPDFWLTAFKNTDIIGEMIQEHDEDVLKYLKDVRCKIHNQIPYGYTIEFYFNDNEYFTNKILTKSYDLSIELNKDDKDPLSYDGPIIYKCQGCEINWNKGKDVTTKLIKKKQKHKATGTIRIVTKEEKQDSFFNFFDTPTEDGLRPSYRHFLDPSLKEDDIDEDLEQLCEADFELGHFFKEFMIPKSVLYFTGELVDESNSYDDDEFDDEDDFDDDDDDDDDDDENDSIKDISSIKNDEDDSTNDDVNSRNTSHKLRNKNKRK